MFAKFFKAPTYSGGSWSTFQNDFIYATNRIVSYEYTKRFSAVGNFSLVLPFDKELLAVLEINGTVYYDGDWLLIDTIRYDDKQIVISGKDCKGLLDLRVTSYYEQGVEGAEGYDVVSGTTAQCVKHYIDSNAISPTDAARKLPVVWQSGASGLASDSYMARLEYLSEVISNLCDGADIGYDVRGNMTGSGFKFALKSGVDRSFDQSTNDRILFSEKWQNVKSISFEHSVSELYNEIYAVDSNDRTSNVSRGSTPSYIQRRECTVNVGVSSTDPETSGYFDKYALAQVEDNVETHSYTVDPSATGYGTDYDLGDKVTVIDRVTGNRFDAVITEAVKSYSQGAQNITLSLGKQKKKPLQRIVNDLIGGVARRR